MRGINTVHAVNIGPDGLHGDLVVPERATGIILFAHGSGSGRHSPRNRYVASVFQQGGLATLLLDLLTAAEEQAYLDTGHLRFGIGLLAERVLGASDWLVRVTSTPRLQIAHISPPPTSHATIYAP